MSQCSYVEKILEEWHAKLNLELHPVNKDSYNDDADNE